MRNPPHTRLVFSDHNHDGQIDPAAGEIHQINDYYPFGLKHPIAGYPNDATQKYLYNGKLKRSGSPAFLAGELQEGTDWLDYGARMYDAALGRWFVVDALAEKELSYSPYTYVTNNPNAYVDLDGNFKRLWAAKLFVRLHKGNWQIKTVQTGRFKGRYYVCRKVNMDDNFYFSNNDIHIDVEKTDRNIPAAGITLRIRFGWFGRTEPRRPLIKGPNGIEFNSSWRNLHAWMEHWDSEWKSRDQAPEVIKNAVEINPIIGVTNAVKTISTGEDIYEEEVEGINSRYVAPIIKSIPKGVFGFTFLEELLIDNIITESAEYIDEENKNDANKNNDEE